LPESLQVIDLLAFHGCLILERVTFEGDRSLVKIDPTAFHACPRLNDDSFDGLDDDWHTIKLVRQPSVCVSDRGDGDLIGHDQALVSLLLF
jgi:hypothetical protein